MKKVIYILNIALLGVLLTSCFSNSSGDSLKDLVSPEVKFNDVTIEGLYSMKIPDFMTVTDQLQEDASLQYNNPFKEKYITVLDETREDIMTFMSDYGVYDESKSELENYVDTRLSYFNESGSTIIKQTKLESKTINGRKAYSTVIDASVPAIGESATYFFTYIQGKDHFYMISAWTLLDRKAGYADEVDVMMKSFKEL